MSSDRGYLTGLVKEFAENSQVQARAELEFSLLSDLVTSFETSPVMVRRAMKELLARLPGKFYSAALQILKSGGTGAGYDFLVSLLLENELLLNALADPEAFPARTAAGLAADLHRMDPQLDAKLMRHVLKEAHNVAANKSASIAHVLSIVDEISDCSRLIPFLMKLSKHPDKHLSSKAIFLLVRAHRNVDWLQQQMGADDPRFRANAIEGMLYSQPSEKELQLLWAAAADTHHRVATTALRVLYHFEQPEAGEHLVDLARHPLGSFRAGAAWAMGETGDRKFLEVLQVMAKSEVGIARRAAIKAAVKLRGQPEASESILSGTI